MGEDFCCGDGFAEGGSGPRSFPILDDLNLTGEARGLVLSVADGLGYRQRNR